MRSCSAAQPTRVRQRLVDALKAQDGDDILKFGTGELSRTLLEHGLIDELHPGSSP